MECTETETIFRELHEPLTAERAAIEARRCLECGGPYAPAPCSIACPTHIDIPRFIEEIRLEDPLAAARTIFAANSLGGSCARVCPVEVLCQGSCVLNKEGRRPVAIGQLQRYATDWAFMKHQNVLTVLKGQNGRSKSIGVIGAGPASLSCAAELAKLGHDVTTYEAQRDFGGLITHAIAPYKLRHDPIPQEVEQIRQLGVQFEMGTRVGIDLTIQQLEERHGAIFLGIGLGEDMDLNIEGAKLPGVWRSLDFIERIKAGRLNELKVGARVAVIGGGNTAIDAAREAVRFGAKDVLVLYRRTRKEMPAYAHEVKQAEAEGVRFSWLTAPVKFMGDGHLKSVECTYMKLVAPDESGRPRAEPVPGTEFALDVDTVILAIGQRARSEFLQSIEDLELDHGLVKINEHHQTTSERYFAGGDCTNGGGTAVEAVQHGKLAAQGIHEYVMSQHIAPARKRRERR